MSKCKKIYAILAATMFLLPVFVIGSVVASPFLIVGSIFGSNDEAELLLRFRAMVESPARMVELERVVRPFLQEQEHDVRLTWFLYSSFLLQKPLYKRETLETIYKYSIDENGPVEPLKFAENVIAKNQSVVTPEQFVKLLDSSEADTHTNFIGASGEWNYPLKSRAMITAEFNGYPGHNGIDLAYAGGSVATWGKPIYSATDGIVAFSGDNRRGSGWSVEVSYGSYQIRYLHMNAISYLKKGDSVKAGQYMGGIGATGKVTGAHLHFEIRKNNKPINPRQFIKF